MILSYHGCHTDDARLLLRGESFHASENPYDWLGKGVYFWESDPVRAYQWAVARRSNSPCVVGAVVDPGNCLDLTKQSGIAAVQRAYSSYISLQTKFGKAIPQNLAGRASEPSDFVRRFLDCAVIDHLHDLYAIASKQNQGVARSFDTVRALFPEGKELFERSGFKDKTHIQIAVRNQKQILGVFRVPVWQLAELSLPLDIYSNL
jgi:hypothetical protein